MNSTFRFYPHTVYQSLKKFNNWSLKIKHILINIVNSFFDETKLSNTIWHVSNYRSPIKGIFLTLSG
jgi:hypothetical protein